MAAHQAPPSLGFSRQEHWSGLPSPSPMHESEKWKWSHSVVSDSSRPRGLCRSLLRFMSTELAMLSNHLILSHPLLLLSSFSPWILQARTLERVPSPSVGHVLSEPFTMIRPSWVALQGKAHWVMQAPSPQQGCNPWRGVTFWKRLNLRDSKKIGGFRGLRVGEGLNRYSTGFFFFFFCCCM